MLYVSYLQSQTNMRNYTCSCLCAYLCVVYYAYMQLRLLVMTKINIIFTVWEEYARVRAKAFEMWFKFVYLTFHISKDMFDQNDDGLIANN